MAEKKLNIPVEAKRALIEPHHLTLSIRRQCALLGLNRATYYYHPLAQDSQDL